jgi:single-strand DNA-binding protein
MQKNTTIDRGTKMQGINTFTIAGNLSTEVKAGKTKNGTVTAWYVVAVNEEIATKDGSTKSIVNFIPVTTYGKQAETDHRMTKGTGVEVSGSIASWTSADKSNHGFSFNARSVKVVRSAPVQKEPEPPAADDAWLADYENAEVQKR